MEIGDKACFVPSLDIIRMPERRRSTSTDTTTPAEGFYSTICHELTHWLGIKSRLDRDMSGRFGSEAYAVEELVAELDAAFLCSDLGITPEPRAYHAQYIKNWLEVLKSDKKAIFSAASKASEAANWLHSLAVSNLIECGLGRILPIVPRRSRSAAYQGACRLSRPPFRPSADGTSPKSTDP
ncbi:MULTISPECIES: zincin-like metallopeptidase domain-containing protein [Brucella]|uniref:zincin-like metallopeptidase domain-containing protein n=1 Tax=Brucella TaxID=234 RepID=UPI001FFD36D7|nr:zincin-like metallopeptidase domain-containing protein [Brucella intermedia]